MKIAIDGPSGAGKSSVSKLVAIELADIEAAKDMCEPSCRVDGKSV